MIKVARLFQTYIWIIDTIRRHNGITLEALNAQWTRTQLSDGIPIHRNSFKRYCEAIEDTFRLKVECRKTSLGYQYFLSHTQELHSNNLKNWMLSTMTVAGIVSESRNIQDRILLEHVPSGETFLSEITRAMEHGHTIHIEYQKFTDSEPYCIQVEPWCLKLFRQRWYLLARRLPDGSMRTFALDRMLCVRSAEETFHLPEDFHAASFFRHSFGIFHAQDTPPPIIIRTYEGLGNYYRTLPLHHSQRHIGGTAEYDDFHLQLHPTPDFIQEILSQGNRIEVIKPESLRNEIQSKLKESLERYITKNQHKSPQI